MLNRLQVIPYELELRDTVDAALHQFDRIAAAAVETLRLQNENRARGHGSLEGFNAQGRAQSTLFDALETFLTSYARVSLLLFPVGSSAFTRERGSTLTSCLGIDATSPLNDRDLRDSWIHHDERIDFCVERGLAAAGQVFTRSTEDPLVKLVTFMRVIELDTLRVHYRARDGSPKLRSLGAIALALREIDAKRPSAFDRLPLPE
jgi:hypothetical protein